LENSKSEKKRINILERRLERSGYKKSDYEIVSRDFVFAGKPLFVGDELCNVYYEVKVNHKDKK
jgi:hypothetical protein